MTVVELTNRVKNKVVRRINVFKKLTLIQIAILFSSFLPLMISIGYWNYTFMEKGVPEARLGVFTAPIIIIILIFFLGNSRTFKISGFLATLLSIIFVANGLISPNYELGNEDLIVIGLQPVIILGAFLLWMGTPAYIFHKVKEHINKSEVVELSTTEII
jgi:hypothetical protein